MEVEMIIAAIPTMPGREPYLQKALDTLVPQTDLVVVFVNGFINKVKRDGVYYIDGADHGSARRFELNNIYDGWLHLGTTKDTAFAFCDDDILYPPDYMAVMHDKLRKLGGAVTCLGRVIDPDRLPLRHWNRGDFKACYPCFEANPSDVRVDICGTGVLMVDPKLFAPKMEEFHHKNYDDVEFSVLARKSNIPIYCIQHSADWLKYLEPPMESTIWFQTLQRGHLPLMNLVNFYWQKK